MNWKCAGAATVAACLASGVAQADALTAWTPQILDTIRQNGDFESGSPGAVSRYTAIVYVSIYDAVNSITRTHEPYLGFEHCPPDTSIEAAIHSAAYTALVGLFPEDEAQFHAVYEALLALVPDGPQKEAGIALGASCAKICLAARADDGSTDTLVYNPIDEPGYWRPTFPDFTGPWGEHWGLVTPWCLASCDQFRPDLPYGYQDMASLLASPEYAADFNEVKSLGALFSDTRTEDQTIAAAFWANDRNGSFKPPGHLIHITEQIADVMGSTLEERVRLYALASLAMADAGVSCWDTKYSTEIDLWRPITAIWEADTDGNPDTEADPTWLSLSFDPTLLIFMPPFPAWASGHATFGAAHAAVVRNFFGTDKITFSATSDDTPGYWRTFHSLDEAARENANSRIWLGVHFRVDAETGYELGTTVGNYISANFLRRLGDLNGDAIVDGADLGILLSQWDETKTTADLNRDGVVDGADLGILLSSWG